MKTQKLKVSLNEIKRMKELAGIIPLNEWGDSGGGLRIAKSKSKNGYKRVSLRAGDSLRDGQEILLSVDEAKELQKLAKKFTSQRKSVSVTVNTGDTDKTQSSIIIEPEDDGKMTIYRKEGSIYRDYDSNDNSSYYGGILKVPQSAAYELVDKLGSFTN
jgi:hypothetical protein